MMNDALSIASGSDKDVTSSVDSSTIKNRWVRNVETGRWVYEPCNEGKGAVDSSQKNRSKVKNHPYKDGSDGGAAVQKEVTRKN